jgi:hypothetical protein
LAWTQGCWETCTEGGNWWGFEAAMVS